ncbi:MAG: transglycosylase domain-containing protein [Chitinophagales bacterium]|nr:transglycosylase domain-containing protein [Chitinophagales bacterium]
MSNPKKKSSKGSSNDLWKYNAYFWLFFLACVGSVGLFFYLISIDVFGKLPTFESLENPKSELASEIISSDGEVLGKYFSQNRTNAKYSELPPNLVNALIATEDIRFYNHSGVDVRAIARAVSGLGSKGGGSTLSQQLAKNLFPRENLNKIKLIIRKLKEWIIAVRLEKCYTKDEILTMYLNTVEFSSNSYGIKSAAKTYFNKQVDSLNVEEGAILVGMLQAPSKYNPKRNPERAFNRRNTVLAQMKKYEYLKPEEFDSLKSLPITLNYQAPSHTEGLAPYFRERLRLEVQQWLNEYGKLDTSRKYNLYTDGLKIYTTIDSRLQSLAEKAVTQHMKMLQTEFAKQWEKDDPWKDQKEEFQKAIKNSERYRAMKEQGASHDSIMASFKTKIPMSIFTWEGERDTVITPLDSLRHHRMFLQAGFLAVDPLNGQVRAWVGGINYKYFQYDHVTTHRQIGSTFKPFIYTAAIDNGWSPCFKILDVAYTFEDFNNWTPQNAEREGFTNERYTLMDCLADSRNSCSAYLMKQIGPQPIIDLVRKLGIESHIDPYPSICLGTPDLTLQEMVGAYTAFANKGVFSKPTYITRIEDKNGNVIQEFPTESIEAMSEQTAFIMVEMLRYVVRHGTGVRLWIPKYEYQLQADMGGKTGTTQNHSDGWFMGITPQLIAGVWVGGEDRFMRFESMKYGQGASSALPIWALFFKSLYADSTLGYSQEVLFERPQERLTIELDCSKYGKFGTKEDPFKSPKGYGEAEFEK